MLLDGIEKLVYWLPVIWRDRDWDHDWFYIVMRHKLQAMRRMLLTDPYEGALHSAERAAVAIGLLDGLLADRYEDEALVPFYEKWGEPEVIENKGSIRIVYPKAFDDDESQVHDELLAGMKQGWIRRTEDLAKLYEILQGELEDWGW
jgi:hypothetical protein